MRRFAIITMLLVLSLTNCFADSLTVMDEYDLLTQDEIKAGVLLDPETLFAYVILDDDTVKIIRYTWISPDVSIPEQIQGKQVSCLGDYAFLDSPTTNVFLSHSDIQIEESAFDYFEGVVWLPGDHPTLSLRLVPALVRNETETIEYYSLGSLTYNRYVEINDYSEVD